MCIETCVKISDKADKNEEVIAYTSRVLRSEREQPDMTSHAAYKGGGGGGVMVKCIAFSYGSYLLMLFLPKWCKGIGCAWYQTSVIHETS